jgi:hypothetical protein
MAHTFVKRERRFALYDGIWEKIPLYLGDSCVTNVLSAEALHCHERKKTYNPYSKLVHGSAPFSDRTGSNREHASTMTIRQHAPHQEFDGNDGRKV